MKNKLIVTSIIASILLLNGCGEDVSPPLEEKDIIVIYLGVESGWCEDEAVSYIYEDYSSVEFYEGSYDSVRCDDYGRYDDGYDCSIQKLDYVSYQEGGKACAIGYNNP